MILGWTVQGKQPLAGISGGWQRKLAAEAEK